MLLLQLPGGRLMSIPDQKEQALAWNMLALLNHAVISAI